MSSVDLETRDANHLLNCNQPKVFKEVANRSKVWTAILRFFQGSKTAGRLAINYRSCLRIQVTGCGFLNVTPQAVRLMFPTLQRAPFSKVDVRQFSPTFLLRAMVSNVFWFSDHLFTKRGGNRTELWHHHHDTSALKQVEFCNIGIFHPEQILLK